MSSSAAASCRLYLITRPRIADLGAFAASLEEALAGGDVACLQLRLKGADGAAPRGEIEAAAARLGPIAHAHDAAFLINDDPELARDCGADGVHIGQADGGYERARALVGPGAIVGVTCHASRHLAMEAGEAGADYVAFGAFHPSATKEAKARAAPEILTWWSELFTVPCVAIGGIEVDNCRPLIAAGADFLAVSSGVWGHPQGPGAAVRAFHEAFNEVFNEVAAETAPPPQDQALERRRHEDEE